MVITAEISGKLMINNTNFLSDSAASISRWVSDALQNGVDWRSAYAFWAWSDDVLGQLHMYAAIAALLVGAITLARRKGDIAHRLLGLMYVFSMFATNVTALTMYTFTGGLNFFHVAAAISLVTAVGALVSIVVYAANHVQRALETHIELMTWSYYGVVLAAIAEIVTRGLGPQIDGWRAFWTVFVISMAISGVIGAILVNVYVRDVKRRWFGAEAKTV